MMSKKYVFPGKQLKLSTWFLHYWNEENFLYPFAQHLIILNVFFLAKITMKIWYSEFLMFDSIYILVMCKHIQGNNKSLFWSSNEYKSFKWVKFVLSSINTPYPLCTIIQIKLVIQIQNIIKNTKNLGQYDRSKVLGCKPVDGGGAGI